MASGPKTFGARGVSDHGDVYDAKGHAAAEIVGAANEIGRQRVGCLLCGLAQNHGAEAREDFEQVERRHDGFNVERTGEDEPKEAIGLVGLASLASPLILTGEVCPVFF